MTREGAREAAQSAGLGKTSLPELIHAGLDALDFGFAVFDRDLRLVTCNRGFRTLRRYPVALCVPGTRLAELYRFNAERGDYGSGSVDKQVETRLARARQRRSRRLEYKLATNRILNIRYAPIEYGGLLVSYVGRTGAQRAQSRSGNSGHRDDDV